MVSVLNSLPYIQKVRKRAAVGEASPRAYLQTQPKTDVKCEYLNLIMIPATDKLHNRDSQTGTNTKNLKGVPAICTAKIV